MKRVAPRAPALLLAALVLTGCGAGTSARTTATSAPAITTSTSTGTSTTIPGTSPTTARTGATATTATTKAVGTSTTGAVTAGSVQLTDGDDGTTVRVAKGTTIAVVLSSTYWTFPNAPNAAVLQQMGAATTSPAPVGTCIPGGGCGTVTATYKAVGIGQASISASRTSCGEARTCTGNQGSYSIQVVVTGG